MAKDPDKLAADFDAEGSGLLAEEEAFDRRLLWRLGSWGLGAVGAVTIAVMANQSALTLKRDQVAAVDIARQAQQLQTLAKDSHNEARRLAAAIDTLNGDRDRLYSRVTSLEQGLDSVTGTVAKQVTAPAPTATAVAAAPAALPAAPASSPPAIAPPALAPVATTPSATSSDRPAAPDKASASIDSKASGAAEKPSAVAERPVAADKKSAATKPQAASERLAPESAPPVSGAAAASIASPMTAAAAGADEPKIVAPAPPVAEKPVTDKPVLAMADPAAGKPTEPVKAPTASDVSAAPIPPLVITPDPDSEIEDDAGAPKAQIQRTEFGIDLGTANSVNGLRALWRGLLKSKSNAPLAALRPIIVIKESTSGLGMQLRLVAGPLNDAGTAAKICAGLSLNQRTCETAIYDGQRLSLKNDDPPAAGRPAHRRAAPRRAVAPPPPPVAEEKKPEPTTFSSMFRRNGQ
ncbi:hypothetical protein JQ633_20100 [Bradyrhizobium tropiciagri]|uniref:hypothetical protein n=1 Tax=Bradyrhizobium tropiciagri TaxID=312253 RepID=UPI001BA5646B|nr:hypothetical protein [Bradyrhizobium tropiciagri]MBR0872675.1 hypothetical protein [Bradyrhizobium tropiciagri]